MEDKYLFISSGCYDGYWVSGVIVGNAKNISLVEKELKKIDQILLDLKKLWITSPTDTIPYKEWKDACQKYEDEIPEIATKFDCKYVHFVTEFHFGGMDV